MNSETSRTRTIARKTAIVLLFFLGITALLGSLPMILDPSGESMQLPPEILEGTPFETFRIPALLLGVFNGLMSLVLAVLVIRKVKPQAWLVMLQGCTLITWLTAEVLMDLFFAALTLPYYVVGILLLISGILMRRSTPV